MAIKGSLREASLADVLQLLALGRKTGCLSVFDRSNFGRIYLDRGRITQASIINRKDRLGDLLVKGGVVRPDVLSTAIERQTGQDAPRLGEILVSAGAITRDQLDYYIGIQIEEAVFFLFTWTQGNFHFEAGSKPEEGDALVSINPERLLLEGARRVDEWALIEKKIPTHDTVFQRVDDEEIIDLRDLTGEQRSVLDLLDGQRSVAEVIEAAGLLEFEAIKALYGIVQAGLARPHGRKPRVVGVDRTSRLEEHLNLGAAFYQTGMLEEAEREFIRILEIDPMNWEAAFRLAAIEIRSRRYREGARRLMRLIGEGRHAPSVFHNLALCLEALGRPADALLTIDEGLKAFPEHPALLLARGVLLVKTGKPGAGCIAFDAYGRVASRVEARPAAFFVFSVLALGASGRLPEAIERAEEGLRAYPRSAPLLLHSGLVLERSHRLADATTRYQRAVDEDPTLIPARRALADALFQQGILDEAGEVYRGLLMEEAGGAEIRFRLGEIAYERGDRTGAVTYWRETIEADPHHAQARAKLESAERELHSAGR